MRAYRDRADRAVLAHHLHQHALAQAAIRDPQPRQRKRIANGIENRAARQHQIGALNADAVVVGALLIAHREQAGDRRGDVGVVHPDAVDPAAIVARQIEVDAGERGHGAGGAEQMHVRRDRAVLGRERRHVLLRPPAPSRVGLRRDVLAAEMLGQRDDAERNRHPCLDARRRALLRSGSRSIRTNSVDPPPISNRMAPRALADRAAASSRSPRAPPRFRDRSLPAGCRSRLRPGPGNRRHWRPRGRLRWRSAAGVWPSWTGFCRGRYSAQRWRVRSRLR